MTPISIVQKGDTGSNKPEKHAVAISEIAYSHHRHGGYTASILKPKIDRLSLTYPVTSLSLREKVRKRFLKVAKDSADQTISFWPKNKNWGSGKYDLSFRLRLTETSDALVQFAAAQSNVSFARIEMNPNLCGNQGLEVLWGLLADHSLGELSFKSISDTARVTRLDIAVDIVNIDIEDMLVRSAKDGKSCNYYSPAGKLETQYLNINSHGSNLYVYDKKASQKDVAHYGNTKYTRVEFRTTTSKPLNSIETLKNPLKKIELIDIEAISQPEDLHHWLLFQDSCRYRGVVGALKLIPQPLRSQYENAIGTQKHTLWQPGKIWEYWPEAVGLHGLQ